MSAAKVLGGFVVLGVVAAGGLYVGDRYAESRAEAYARDVVTESIHVTAAPVVDIKGFPFLTQLFGGTLDEVTASVDGATLDGIGVTDVAVDARSVDVRPPAGRPSTAGRATVAATIRPASIETIVRDRTGLVVRLAVNGSALQASGNVLGLPLVLDLVPRVDSGRLLTDVQALTLAGRQITVEQLPGALRTGLSGIQVPVEGLPAGLSLTQAQVVPAGVRITASGTDVPVPRTAAGG